MNHGLSLALRCNKYSSRDSFCQNTHTHHFLLLFYFLPNFRRVATEFCYASCLCTTVTPLLAQLPAITVLWTGTSNLTSFSPETVATRISTPLCQNSQSLPCVKVRWAPSLKLTLQGSAERNFSLCGSHGSTRLFRRRIQSEYSYTSLRHVSRLLPPVDGCTLLLFFLKRGDGRRQHARKNPQSIPLIRTCSI